MYDGNTCKITSVLFWPRKDGTLFVQIGTDIENPHFQHHMDETGLLIQFFKPSGDADAQPNMTGVRLIPDDKKFTTERYFMRDGFVHFESDRSGLSLVISAEVDDDEKKERQVLYDSESR